MAGTVKTGTTSTDTAAELLADLAISLGADAVGWANAGIPPEAVAEYQSWLEEGRHARMSYLERQLPRRADLSTSLEGAGRVLVLGVSHAYAKPPKTS